MTRVRTIAAATIGNIVEWYDFALYTAATPFVFQRLFFPQHNDGLMEQLGPILVFAAGFLVRPAGGVVFGLLGDRWGHARALRYTLTIIGLATVSIGMLPVHATLGMGAPLLLLMLRLAQGFAAGGEWAGAVLLLGNDIPERQQQRGVAFALTQSGVAAGMVLGSAALWLARQLPDPTFLSWGWRIPFVATLPLLLLGLWLRSDLQMDKPTHKHGRPSIPVQPMAKALLMGTLIRLAENGGVYLMLVFGLTYGRMHHVPDTWLLLASTVGMVTDGLAIPLFGLLSDHLGRRTVFAIGAVGLTLFFGPFLRLITSGTEAGVIVAFVVGTALCHAPMIAVEPALLSSLFPPAHRYLGVAAAHEAGAVLAGGASPVIAMLLIHTRWGEVAVCGYMAVLASLSLAALFATPEQQTVFPRHKE